MLYKQINLQPKLPKLLEWVEQMFPDIQKKRGKNKICERQGSKPILNITNQTHTQLLSKSVDIHSKNVKAIQAELIEELGVG